MRNPIDRKRARAILPSSLRASASQRLNYVLAFLSAVLALLLYLRTLAPGLLGGDSGEFQLAAWLGGFVHPTGYPLYLILGYLWTHLLPVHDPAWRMNVFSALWGGVATGLVYFLTHRLLRDRRSRADLFGPQVSPSTEQCSIHLAATFAALTFAVTPTFWSQAVIAEVYTLHAAFVSALLLAVVGWGESRDPRAGYVVAGLLGLSLTHHRTMLLLVPAIVAYLWLSRDAAKRSGVAFGPGSSSGLRARALTVTLIIAPFVLYAWTPLRAPGTPYATLQLSATQTLVLYAPTLDGFVSHVTGQAFGTAIGTPAQAMARVIPACRLFVQEVSWVGLVLGIVGVGWLAWGRPRFLVLTGLGFLATVGFNLFYGIGDIYAFYIPAYLIWVLWMAAGAAAMASVLSRWVRGWAARAVVAPWLLFLLLPAWLFGAHFAALDQSDNTTSRVTWESILSQPMPEDAILVSNDRDEMMPFWYLKYVEGRWPDRTALFPLLLPGSDWSDVVQVAGQAFRTGRPVYLVKPMPGLEVKLTLGAAMGEKGGSLGPITPVLSAEVTHLPDQPVDIVFADAVRLIGYDLEPQLPGTEGELTVMLYWQPLRPLGADYTTFVHVMAADGARIGQSDHRPGGVYYATGLWRPGDILRDEHRIRLTGVLDHSSDALEVGLYTGASELRHLGQPQRIRLTDRQD